MEMLGFLMVMLGEISPMTSLQQAIKVHHISKSTTGPNQSLTMKVKMLIQKQRGSVGTLTTTSILIVESTSMAMMVV